MNVSENISISVRSGIMLSLKELKTEYQTNPLGLDVANPAFSWILESDKENTLQKSYQILVSNSDGVVWDSGVVTSEQSIHVPYKGSNFEPSTIYQVQVQVVDNHDETAEITRQFETGLLNPSNLDWQWISHSEDLGTVAPVYVIEFSLDKLIKSARIYATALGAYELELNGKKVGDHFLAPGWTSYHHRLQYQTYDITEELTSDNTLKMTVANGWYKGLLGFAGQANHYGDQVAALVAIRLEDQNGTVRWIFSDEDWQYETGPIQLSEIYLGEHVDFTAKSKPRKSVSLFEHGKDMLVAQENEPTRVTMELSPIEKIITPKGEVVLDFGQNLTGVVKCQISQPRGTEIIFSHAEVLDKDGNFYTENLREAISQDHIIASGGIDTFMPKFTFHGFRYLRVEGLVDEIELSDFTACVIHTDMEKTGDFVCSNKLVNRLYQNIQWGQRGNFLDVPTDCPQRDERLGWTGDAQVFASTAVFNFNSALFFRKWLRDLKVEQSEQYGVPHVVPNILGNQDGAAGWSDAATIIPWELYRAYGDKRILEDQYSSMKGWVDYITSKTQNGIHLWQQGFQYGDWVALDKEESSDRVGATDIYFIASAYYAVSTKIVADAAEILGFKEEASHYQQQYQDILSDFRNEYATRTGRLVSETQTACILALYFNLVEGKDRSRVMETLVTNLNKHKNHLTTGFIGTPYLCHALSENGQHELAGQVFLKEDYPSWLYAVKKGATTIWERWNSLKEDGSFDESGMNSFNHYAYGSIGSWMHQKLAGIQIIEPGYKVFRIQPQFIKGISWGNASLKSPYGLIEVNWRCENGQIQVDVTIPTNTHAQLVLPEKEEIIELGSGRYHYEYPTDTDLSVARYSMDSTLKEILDQPLAVDILETYMPGMTTNDMIQFAYDLSINELIVNMPAEGKQLFETVINALNQSE